MAILKQRDGVYYVRREGLGNYLTGTHRQARSFFRFTSEEALKEAARIRNEGLPATAVDDSGQSIERGESATAPVDESVVWPSDWRIEIAHGPRGFYHTFYDQQSASTQTIGPCRTPQQVVDRLVGTEHPIVIRYLASLPRVTAPQAIVPVPTPALHRGKVLRPGSVTLSEDDILSLQARRYEREQASARPPANIEYEQFYNTQTAADIQARAKRDSDFMKWIENQAPSSAR